MTIEYTKRLENQIIFLKKQGLSQRAIAKQIGISHVTIQNWLKKGKNDKNSKYHNLYNKYNLLHDQDDLNLISDFFMTDINKLSNINNEYIKIHEFVKESDYKIVDVIGMLVNVRYRRLKNITLLHKYILELDPDGLKATFTYGQLDDLMQQYLKKELI